MHSPSFSFFPLYHLFYLFSFIHSTNSYWMSPMCQEEDWSTRQSPCLPKTNSLLRRKIISIPPQINTETYNISCDDKGYEEILSEEINSCGHGELI